MIASTAATVAVRRHIPRTESRFCGDFVISALIGKRKPSYPSNAGCQYATSGALAFYESVEPDFLRIWSKAVQCADLRRRMLRQLIHIASTSRVLRWRSRRSQPGRIVEIEELGHIHLRGVALG